MITPELICAAIVIGWAGSGLMLHLFLCVRKFGFDFKNPLDYEVLVYSMVMGPMILYKGANKKNKEHQELVAKILKIIEEEKNNKD